MENCDYIFWTSPTPPLKCICFLPAVLQLNSLTKERSGNEEEEEEEEAENFNTQKCYGLIWSRKRLHMSGSTIALSRPKLSLYDDHRNNRQKFLRGIMS